MAFRLALRRPLSGLLAAGRAPRMAWARGFAAAPTDAAAASDAEVDAALELDLTKLEDHETVKAPLSSKKTGTQSPWAAFDSWGADRIHADPLPEDMAMLSEDLLEIETSLEDGGGQPGVPEEVNKTLDAYERVLKSRSGVHFGYPYNLRYNHEELNRFMRFSINNLYVGGGEL